MYNLLRFIKSNHFVLLFLIIECFSIFLLLSKNSFQANKVIQHSTEYTSLLHDYSSSLSNYLDLKQTNEYLSEENAKLYSILNSQESVRNSILEHKKFSYRSAKVVNNSINQRNNFITLNKGKRHGLETGMGVITRRGVIGIIHSVSENYSVVISLLHRKSSLGIKLKKNNQNGILKWEGFNYRVVNITNFPDHISINKGDTIITNSHSIVFPEGINIGEISNFTSDQEGYYNVEVTLFEDFNQLNFVYVIYSAETVEQKELELSVTYE